ncbi:MAG: hypothetical protein RQ760_22015 [Sedimentisphaerales bacterium]|nr:hypothetical protein [Sedimentisphaerales bacterium]
MKFSLSRIFDQLFPAHENICSIGRLSLGNILFIPIPYSTVIAGVTLIQPFDGAAILNVGNTDCTHRQAVAFISGYRSIYLE